MICTCVRRERDAGGKQSCRCNSRATCRKLLSLELQRRREQFLDVATRVTAQINQQRQCKIRVRNSAARKTRSWERSPQFKDRASTTQKLQGSDSFFPASMKRCGPRDCALSQSSNWFSSRRESVNQSVRIRFGMLLVAVVKFRNRHRSNMRISPG